MNFQTRLLEAISNGIYQSLNEGKLTIKEKYDLDKAHNKTKLDFMLYKQACEIDPTYNKEKGLVGIYANWLIQHVENKDQIEQLRLPLEWYADGVKKNILQKQGISSDIGKYKSVKEFLDTMEPLMKTTNIKMSGSEYNNREKLKNQFKVLGSSTYWEIITPLTWEAERWFGRETNWCTVADKEYFKNYNGQKGELIIFYPKDKKLLNQRIQIHFGTKQYCDINDNPYKEIKEAIIEIIYNYDIANDLACLYNKIFSDKEQIILQKEIFINTNSIDIFYKEKKKFKVYDYNIKRAIKYCINKFGNQCDLNFLDTSEVTNMSELFQGMDEFNGNITKWDVSNVEDMSCMFVNTVFNQPIGNWDVSNVKDMSGMFQYAISFNQPIGNWDTSNVENMQYMFQNAKSFNQPIENWDTSNVEDMSYMFSYVNSFNQPIDNWNVSNVEDMSYMFLDAESFNQPIGSWDISNVENMQYMFSGASSFNWPIGDWDVNNVKNMNGMFHNAESFNQSIENWDISNVKYTENMFDNCPIKEQYKPKNFI